MDQTAASFNSALASSNCSDDKAEHSAGAEDAAGPNWERNRKKRAAKKRAQQRKLQLQEAQWACSTACGSTVVESPEPITNTPQTAKQRLQQKLACRQALAIWNELHVHAQCALRRMHCQLQRITNDCKENICIRDAVEAPSMTALEVLREEDVKQLLETFGLRDSRNIKVYGWRLREGLRVLRRCGYSRDHPPSSALERWHVDVRARMDEYYLVPYDWPQQVLDLLGLPSMDGQQLKRGFHNAIEKEMLHANKLKIQDLRSSTGVGQQKAGDLEALLHDVLHGAGVKVQKLVRQLAFLDRQRVTIAPGNSCADSQLERRTLAKALVDRAEVERMRAGNATHRSQGQLRVAVRSLQLAISLMDDFPHAECFQLVGCRQRLAFAYLLNDRLGLNRHAHRSTLIINHDLCCAVAAEMPNAPVPVAVKVADRMS